MGLYKRPIDYKAELEERDKIIAKQAEQIKQLEAKLEELTKLLEVKAESKAAKKPKFTENYSLDKNQRKKKRRKKSTGRRISAQKFPSFESL